MNVFYHTRKSYKQVRPRWYASGTVVRTGPLVRWYSGTKKLLFGLEFLLDGIFVFEDPVEHLGAFRASRGKLRIGLGL